LFLFGGLKFHHGRVANRVEVILNQGGFRINQRKTKYFSLNQPRYTLGLVSHNTKIGLPRKTKRNYRAAFYKASRDIQWAQLNVSKLSGMAEWYKAVYGKNETYDEYQAVIKNIVSMKFHTPYSI